MTILQAIRNQYILIDLAQMTLSIGTGLSDAFLARVKSLRVDEPMQLASITLTLQALVSASVALGQPYQLKQQYAPRAVNLANSRAYSVFELAA
jgi:hypothetical protein